MTIQDSHLAEKAGKTDKTDGKWDAMRTIEYGGLNQQDICVFDITFISGIRSAGKEADKTKGREKNGILYMPKGECRIFRTGEQDLILRAGDVAMLPQDYCYQLRYTAEETEFRQVNFSILSAGGEVLTLSDQIQVLTDRVDVPVVSNLMAKIEIACQAEDDGSVLRRKELLYRLLSLLFVQEHALNIQQTKYANILPGALLLQKTFLEDRPITEFAAACNISLSSFRALFTQYYGMPPSVYRNELRIKRARSLLIDGNCSVLEAATGSGFHNLSYFCRYYKRVTGETPGQTQAKFNG